MKFNDLVYKMLNKHLRCSKLIIIKSKLLMLRTDGSESGGEWRSVNREDIMAL